MIAHRSLLRPEHCFCCAARRGTASTHHLVMVHLILILAATFHDVIIRVDRIDWRGSCSLEQLRQARTSAYHSIECAPGVYGRGYVR